MADEQNDVLDLDRIAHAVLAMDPAEVHRLVAREGGGPWLAGPAYGDGRELVVLSAVGGRGATVARGDAVELVRRVLDHRLAEGTLDEQQHDQMLTEAVVGLSGTL
ncbi:hypothetical protein MO973_27560 [Paenibacillus sp. TRM 82003]|uniref:hypothetical protein n=1 Tax=Kineococcus sp. TRM81007 TaxID=2925831 RepID=UPI001F57D0DA|nr:hypothetical protein [Kineococcus sp. TRM81007]MCI2238339.1 hypothetical protein [Kineococcus sp. TRM81007]MCI3923990.1 hypothetical protein [Paenibacillus sp. TRM 82003]